MENVVKKTNGERKSTNQNKYVMLPSVREKKMGRKIFLVSRKAKKKKIVHRKCIVLQITNCY